MYSPFDVSNKTQLFIDGVLVRSYEGVSFTLHPAIKHEKNPVVVADKPWEGWRVEIFGTVFYDEEEGIYRMWYNGGEGVDEFPDYTCLYAESKDGIKWEKPAKGTIKSRIFEKHNIVGRGCLLPSVIKDKIDPDTGRRYKMVFWREEPGWPKDVIGYHTMVSPDGLNWKQLSKKPIGKGADVVTAFYNRERELYVAIAKIHDYFTMGHKRRCFYVATSKDFINWSEPVMAFVPDLRDDAGSLARIEEVRPILDVPDNTDLIRTEFYGVGVYQHESCVIGFPWVFTVNNEARYGNQEGPGEIQIAVTRDLENWERPFRTPAVPLGKIGEWDCGFLCTSSEALIVGDEVWLYYSGGNYTHGTPCLYKKEDRDKNPQYTGSIGIAKWRRDRFVSVDAGNDGGSLTTVPVLFKGDNLEINALTGNDGSVTVELYESQGNKLMTESYPFKGDELKHKVQWKQQSDFKELNDKPVYLKFYIRDGELYAFGFK